jgi:hypothetical protein
MSEFKFACPVCGQHITADSATSGGHLECPTCFQNIVIPQAPASGESKFILSASQVNKPRPQSNLGRSDVSGGAIKSSKAAIFTGIGLLLVLAAAGAGVFIFRDRIFKKPASDSSSNKATNLARAKPSAPVKTYSVPTNIDWSLDLTALTIPDEPASGKIHGSGFFGEKVTLQGGNLTFRQGKVWPPDLGLSVQLFAQQAEELSGKSVEISPDRAPPVPKVTLRWKDASAKPANRTIPSGYALKVSFGQAANGRIPGKIYVCLPDDVKSFVAGNFEAEIRKPNPPKQKVAKQPKRP